MLAHPGARAGYAPRPYVCRQKRFPVIVPLASIDEKRPSEIRLATASRDHSGNFVR
jgi:hypothetical protein